MTAALATVGFAKLPAHVKARAEALIKRLTGRETSLTDLYRWGNGNGLNGHDLRTLLWALCDEGKVDVSKGDGKSDSSVFYVEEEEGDVEEDEDENDQEEEEEDEGEEANDSEPASEPKPKAPSPPPAPKASPPAPAPVADRKPAVTPAPPAPPSPPHASVTAPAAPPVQAPPGDPLAQAILRMEPKALARAAHLRGRQQAIQVERARLELEEHQLLEELTALVAGQPLVEAREPSPAEAASERGLTPAQQKVLARLRQYRGPSKAKHIATALGMSGGATYHHLNALKDVGLARNGSDGWEAVR